MIKSEKEDRLRSIYEATLVDPNLDPPTFGNMILHYAKETNTEYYDAVHYICNTFGTNINILTTFVLVEKYKDSTENLLHIVQDLNILHEQGKVDFDNAANFISEQFNIPVGKIMHLLFSF